jgi:hypothetical protein
MKRFICNVEITPSRLSSSSDSLVGATLSVYCAAAASSNMTNGLKLAHAIDDPARTQKVPTQHLMDGAGIHRILEKALSQDG